MTRFGAMLVAMIMVTLTLPTADAVAKRGKRVAKRATRTVVKRAKRPTKSVTCGRATARTTNKKAAKRQARTTAGCVKRLRRLSRRDRTFRRAMKKLFGRVLPSNQTLRPPSFEDRPSGDETLVPPAFATKKGRYGYTRNGDTIRPTEFGPAPKKTRR